MKLAAQLSLLRSGRKPALLHDSSFKSAQQVASELNEAEFAVIQFAGTDLVFVANPLALRLRLEHISEVPIVDVTSSCKEPVELKDEEALRSRFASVAEILEKMPESGEIVAMELAGKADFCFLMGAFLGYPVIYANDSPEEDNCLAFEPLCVFHLKANDALVTSFSVPSRFRERFAEKIDAWCQSMASDHLSLTETQVVLPFVAS